MEEQQAQKLGAEQESKSPLKSKTLWVNLLFAVLAFVPPVQAFFIAQPELVGLLVAGVNLLLRVVTKSKIELS